MFTRLLFSVVHYCQHDCQICFVLILKGLTCFYLHEKYIACFFFLRIKENSQFYRQKLHSAKSDELTKSMIDQKKRSRNQGAGATTETTITTTTTHTEQHNVRTHARIRKRGRTNNSYNSNKIKEDSKQQNNSTKRILKQNVG